MKSKTLPAGVSVLSQNPHRASLYYMCVCSVVVLNVALLSVMVPKTLNALALGESGSRGVFRSDDGGSPVPKSQSPFRPSEPRASLGCPSGFLVWVLPLEAAQRGLLQDTLSDSRLSSASQGERKGVNKYYPPDFNPEKVRAGSLPCVHTSKETP